MNKTFLDDYLSNPVEASSLPYWKSLIVSIPHNIRIVKDNEYDKNKYQGYAFKTFGGGNNNGRSCGFFV